MITSHKRRALARENFTSARRRRAISLSMLKVPNIATQPEDRPTTDSLLEVYAEREKYQCIVKCDLHNLNVVQFAIKYKLKKSSGNVVDQPDNLVPRVFPMYSSNPKSTNFGLYCKYQLLEKQTG